MNLESEFLLDVGIEQTSFSKTWQDGTSWLCSFYGQTWKKTHLKNDEKKSLTWYLLFLHGPGWTHVNEKGTTLQLEIQSSWLFGRRGTITTSQKDWPSRLMISFKCHHSLFLLLLLLLTLFVANVYFLLIHTGIAPDNLHSTTIMSSRFLVLTLLTRSLTTVSSARFHLLGVVK